MKNPADSGICDVVTLPVAPLARLFDCCISAAMRSAQSDNADATEGFWKIAQEILQHMEDEE